MPDEGIASFADAFASAESEMGLADPVESEATLPVVEADDASTGNTLEAPADDKPDEEQGAEPESLEGFAELFGGDSDQQVDTNSPGFLETQVTVDTVAGPQVVSIAELQKGYLRQADYTQKTQDVAAQRKAANDAIEFYETFRKDPAEFARTLAVRAGLVDEGAQPIKNIDIAEMPTQEAIDKMVEERVQERLANEPAMKEAKLAQARKAVNDVFDGIEQSRKVSLSQKDREAIIAEANRQQTTNLELVFDAMMSRYRTQQSRRSAAPAAPRGSAAGEKPMEERTPNTLAEAFGLAEAELARA